MRLAAVILLFKERHFIEATVRALYPVVDSICVASQYDRGIAGNTVTPDDGIKVLLSIPDPDNKIRLAVFRNTDDLPGWDGQGKLRNAARALDPKADYYLIVDSDEVWPVDVLRKCWDEVQRTRYAAYRVWSHCYYHKWNYRIVPKGDGYRPYAFIKQGFPFANDRQINWHVPARWKEFLRTGRKPKTVYFPPEWAIHHASCVGDDARILTKINNWGHRQGIDPEWFEKTWKNFDPNMKDFHYCQDQTGEYERLEPIATADLPEEVTRCTWPEGWIDR
jgi:hypothetical protein